MAEETGKKKEQLKLHNLQPAPGSKKEKIRVGRGEGGRNNKSDTAGPDARQQTHRNSPLSSGTARGIPVGSAAKSGFVSAKNMPNERARQDQVWAWRCGKLTGSMPKVTTCCRSAGQPLWPAAARLPPAASRSGVDR